MAEKKIRLVRFMSGEELSKYLIGEPLKNTTKWGDGINKTNSEGFCWFPFHGEEPEKRMEYLTGVVSMDAVLVVDVPRSLVRETYGMYRNPDEPLEEMFTFPPKLVRRLEYCTTNYNRDNFQAVKMGFVKRAFFERKIEWVWDREDRLRQQAENRG